MELTAVLPRKAGRPRSGPGTVRIMASGLMRLSPDLMIAGSFKISVAKQNRVIVLTPGNGPGSFLVWFSSEQAKSGLLSIQAALDELQLDAETIAGEYRAEVKRGKVVVHLARRVGE
jgi:hypothetical protein